VSKSFVFLFILILIYYCLIWGLLSRGPLRILTVYEQCQFRLVILPQSPHTWFYCAILRFVHVTIMKMAQIWAKTCNLFSLLFIFFVLNAIFTNLFPRINFRAWLLFALVIFIIMLITISRRKSGRSRWDCQIGSPVAGFGRVEIQFGLVFTYTNSLFIRIRLCTINKCKIQIYTMCGASRKNINSCRMCVCSCVRTVVGTFFIYSCAFRQSLAGDACGVKSTVARYMIGPDGRREL